MLIIIFFFLQVLKEGKFTLFRRIFSTTTLLSVVVSHWVEFRSINFWTFPDELDDPGPGDGRLPLERRASVLTKWRLLAFAAALCF